MRIGYIKRKNSSLSEIGSLYVEELSHYEKNAYNKNKGRYNIPGFRKGKAPQAMIEKLFGTEFGGGYPPERVVPEQANKKILDSVKAVTHKDMLTILKEIDQDFLKETISGEKFAELFYPNCQVPEIAEYLKSL